jgi:hypothetical protein
LRINEALLCLVTGESDSANLSSVVMLNLHIRDSRYPKIKKISNLHFVRHLRILNMSYNAIEIIEGLDMCPHLTELNLAENQISEIQGLEGLTLLERLNLSGNQLTRIPADGLADLQQLHSLRLSRNRLNVLQDLRNLQPLKKLAKLRIDGNPSLLLQEGEEALEDFVVQHLPQLRELDQVDVSSPAIKQRSWLRRENSNGYNEQDKENRSSRSSNVTPAARRSNSNDAAALNSSSSNNVSAIRRRPLGDTSAVDISTNLSRVDFAVDATAAEGEVDTTMVNFDDTLQFRTPMAAPPRSMSTPESGINDNSNNSSVVAYFPSPAKGFTIPKADRSRAAEMISRVDIDALGGSADSSVELGLMNTSNNSSGASPSSQHPPKSAALGHLQQQVEAVSALLLRAEEEKGVLQEELAESLRQQDALWATTEELRSAVGGETERIAIAERAMEERTRAAFEPELAASREKVKAMQLTAAKMSAELDTQAQNIGALEEQSSAQKVEISRLVDAGKAVQELYSAAVAAATTQAEAEKSALRSHCLAAETREGDLTRALAAIEAQHMLHVEQEQALVQKGEDAMSRLRSTEDRVHQQEQELERLRASLASLAEQLSADQASREQLLLQQAQEDDVAAKVRADAEEQGRLVLVDLHSQQREKEEVLSLLGQAVRRKEEEEILARERLASVTRSVCEATDCRRTEEQERARLVCEIAERKRELEEGLSSISRMQRRREEEERKGAAVAREVESRLQALQSEVTKLDQRHKQRIRELHEAEERERVMEEERDAMRAEWDQERARLERIMFQLKRSADESRQRTVEEEGKLGKARGARRRAEAECEEREKEIQTAVAAMRVDQAAVADELAVARDRVRLVKREYEQISRECDQATEKATDREKKQAVALLALKDEQAELSQKVNALRQQLIGDVAACQNAKDVLQALEAQDIAMRAANRETIFLAQEAARDIDRLRSERDAWRVQVDAERHAVSALDSTKASLEADICRLRSDAGSAVEALRTEKDKEQAVRVDIESLRRQRNEVQEDLGMLQRKRLESEREGEAVRLRQADAQRGLDRALSDKDASDRACHEERLVLDRLQQDKKDIREQISQLEIESTRVVAAHHSLVLERDQVQIAVSSLLQQKQSVLKETAVLQEGKEKVDRALFEARAALQDVEAQCTEKQGEIDAGDRRLLRGKGQLEEEERRVRVKQDELAALTLQLREAQVLLSQTYDSMHVERARALKELEQLEGAKRDATNTVYRVRRASHDQNGDGGGGDRIAGEREKQVVDAIPRPPAASAAATVVTSSGRKMNHHHYHHDRDGAAQASGVQQPIAPATAATATATPTAIAPSASSDLRTSVELLRAQSQAVMMMQQNQL